LFLSLHKYKKIGSDRAHPKAIPFLTTNHIDNIIYIYHHLPFMPFEFLQWSQGPLLVCAINSITWARSSQCSGHTVQVMNRMLNS
jgi:hypothetical protein